MRLLASSFILCVSALDFAFGQPGETVHLLGIVAGLLLALSVIVDHCWPTDSELLGKDVAEGHSKIGNGERGPGFVH
jgi:hypothetical protein